jgi:Fe-S-cluster containining protein
MEAGAMPGRVEDENTPAFIKAMKRLFPGFVHHVEALFPLRGKRWRLATNANGDCVFLGPEGCRLPRDARPWYCKLFPIWLKNGRFDLFTATECVVMEEAHTLAQALQAVQLTAEEARELHVCLYRDWGLDGDQGMARPAGS